MPAIACINATSKTLTNLISQSLSSPSPPEIRAIVRSEKRFLSKLPSSLLSSSKGIPKDNASSNQNPNLTVHEYSDYSDPSPLIPVLSGVDTIFVALGVNDNRPTTLNQDVLQVLVSALATSKPANSTRSPTKIVLLSAHPTTPYNLAKLADGTMSFAEQFFHTRILKNQYADLIRAQDFLMRQSPWLDWVVVSPGMIVDDISDSDPETGAAVAKATFELALQDPKSGGKEPHDAISYARLARAMLAAAHDSALVGQNVSPIATGSKVQVGWQGMQVQREVIAAFLTTDILPTAVRWGLFGALCGGIGFVLSGGRIAGWGL